MVKMQTRQSGGIMTYRAKEEDGKQESLIPYEVGIAIMKGNEMFDSYIASLNRSTMTDEHTRFTVLLGISEVLIHTQKVSKYPKHSWKEVPEARQSFFDAFQRHDQHYGNSEDAESGLFHWKHAACNLLFLLWFDMKKDTINIF